MHVGEVVGASMQVISTLFGLVQRYNYFGMMLQGPDLTNPLLGILLRFRQEKIAIIADIEAMYYKVQVQEDHRVKVDRMLEKELNMKLQISTFWTDSTSVLKYIHNQTKRFHTYVANRIAVIHNLSQESQWRHVSSKDNPADFASRGLNI